MKLRQARKITKQFDQRASYRVSSLRRASRRLRNIGMRMSLWCILGKPDKSERHDGFLSLREKWKGK